VWVLVASLLVFCVRLSWPAYEAAWPTRDFTLAMLISRLLVSFIASIASGALAARLEYPRGRAPLVNGLLQLMVAVPYHLSIWPHYPAWYHLFYLLSLVPLALLGARLFDRKPNALI
jgi:hypothetical protein